MNVAERIGTGLKFINEFRKKYPRDPRLPYGDYMSLLGYLSKTAKALLQAGTSLKHLGNNEIITSDMFPRNFFVNPGSGVADRYMFHYRYNVVNSVTNEIKTYTGYFWSNQLGNNEELKRGIIKAEQARLNTISMSHPRGVKYSAQEGSVVVLAIVKRY